MTAFVEDEMEHLRARISALQDQKQNLLNSALSKSSQGASCDGECTDRQSNNSTANEHFSTHLTREEDNNTSFLFIGVLSVARNSGQMLEDCLVYLHLGSSSFAAYVSCKVYRLLCKTSSAVSLARVTRCL